MKNIYLDHAATTPVRLEVIEAMTPFFSEVFANPSSLHTAGQKARRALDEARETVAWCLGALPDEITFTSGGTESDNLALKGALRATRKRHVIVSAIEHRAVLNTADALAECGIEITHAPVDSFGVVDREALRKLLRPDTGLVSVMLGNNETGVLQPVQKIAAMTRSAGITMHTDAVQTVGKVLVNVDALGVDLLSVSAHKFNGPKGVGALYVRRGTRIAGLIHGGHQEHEHRAGTENLPGIVGLAKAMDLACREMPEQSVRLAALRDRLEQGILESIPGVHVNGHPTRRLPQILSVAFDGVNADELLMALDVRGVSASVGSACMAGAMEGSHVLQAMGLRPELIKGSMRFSFGRDNTIEEVDQVLAILRDAVGVLRRMSKAERAGSESSCGPDCSCFRSLRQEAHP
ncbi:MAG: cysteine desulfurase family protein [Candidatus Acidiferrales bacterium]|jgi:cysteine desulfurase